VATAQELGVIAYCQIEHVDSDSAIGSPCSNRAVAEVLTAEPRFVLTVVRGVVDSHFVRY
jgi:hypothetical protein